MFLITNCKKEVLSDKIIDDGRLLTSKARSVKSTNTVSFFDAALNSYHDLSAYNKIPGDPYTAMVINPGCISVINDPVFGSKRKVMLMNVAAWQNGGVTGNPRAQVQTPMQYKEGQEVYAGFSVRFKAPVWTYFLTFAEFYGAPYNGTAPFRLGIQESNIIAASFDGTKQVNLWKEPMEANTWYDFVYREVLSKDAKKGEVQVWLRKQGDDTYTEILPATKLATVTRANLTGPNYHKLACYYDKNNTYTDNTKKTKVSAVQMYLTNHKIGGSFDAVAPKPVK